MIHPLIALERQTISDYLSTCIEDLRSAMAAVGADSDPEIVHRCRVCLRRLRGSLKSLGRFIPSEDVQSIGEECGWLFNRSGSLRDYDVLLEALPSYTGQAGSDDQRIIDQLTRELTASRNTALRAFERSCNSQRAARLLVRLEQFNQLSVEHPHWSAQLQASRLLDRCFRKLAARVAEINQTSSAAEIHSLRKYAKRLRYLLDLYDPVYRQGALEPSRKRLRKLQNLLGAYQDLDAHAAMLSTLAQKHLNRARPNTARAELIASLLPVIDSHALKTRARIHKRLQRNFCPEIVAAERAVFRQLPSVGWPKAGFAGYCHQLNGKRSKLPLGKLVCAGRNYAEHAVELGNEVPEKPLLFIKPAASMVDFAGSIEIPVDKGAVHYELEIAVLLSKPLRNATAAQAKNAIAGLGLALDLTLRDLQSELKRKGLPWEPAKGFDGACPITGFKKMPQDLTLDNLCMRLNINGERRQLATSAEMITPIAELIAYASSLFSLWPGDVILTGTPSGVGALTIGDRLNAELYGLLETEATVISPRP